MFEELDPWIPDVKENEETRSRKIHFEDEDECHVMPWPGSIDSKLARAKNLFTKLKNRIASNDWTIDAAGEAWNCVECYLTAIAFYCTCINVRNYFYNKPTNDNLTLDNILTNAGKPESETFKEIYYSSNPRIPSRYSTICGISSSHRHDKDTMSQFVTAGIFPKKPENEKTKFQKNLRKLLGLQYDARGKHLGFRIINPATGNLKYVQPITDENAKDLVLDTTKEIFDYIDAHMSSKGELKKIKAQIPTWPTVDEINELRKNREMRGETLAGSITAKRIKNAGNAKKQAEIIAEIMQGLSIEDQTDVYDELGDIIMNQPDF